MKCWSPHRWWLPFHEDNILKSQPVLTNYVFKKITKIINAFWIMLSRLMSCLLSFSLRLSVSWPECPASIISQGDSPCLGYRLRVYPFLFLVQNPPLWQFRALPRCIFKILCFNFFGWFSFPPFLGAVVMVGWGGRGHRYLVIELTTLSVHAPRRCLFPPPSNPRDAVSKKAKKKR